MTTISNNSNVLHYPAQVEQSSPIVQQPQSIKSTNNLSTSNSSYVSMPLSPVNKLNTQNSNESSSQNSNSSKVTSVSYLDDSNLKLAVIDYSDILKLIKLQNSIEYQEWMAFNSKILLFIKTNY